MLFTSVALSLITHTEVDEYKDRTLQPHTLIHLAYHFTITHITRQPSDAPRRNQLTGLEIEMALTY